MMTCADQNPIEEYVQSQHMVSCNRKSN